MAHEALTSLRAAVLLSRSMRGLAERGEIRELVVRMHERELLLNGLFDLLGSLKGKSTGESAAAVAWSEVLSAVREFETENALLIEGLKVQRKTIVRNIAEAESHRRLSAYVA